MGIMKKERAGGPAGDGGTGLRLPMRAILAGMTSWIVLLGAFSAAAETRWFDETEIRGYDYTGPYGQFGVAIGRIDYDDVGPFDVDSEVSGGFTLTGGYRFLPWLAAEANFTFLGGEDNVEIGSIDADSEYFAFTFGPKIYPLGAFEAEEIPHLVQPYGLIQIGGGEGEIDGPGNGSVDEDSFVARFLIGFDVWATDHIGFFVEGGGHVIEEDAVDGAGIFTLGGQYRF